MRNWEEIRCNYINEDDMFWRVDAWKYGEEEGEIIAYIDDMTCRVIYCDPLARVDEQAQEVINETVIEIQSRDDVMGDYVKFLQKPLVGKLKKANALRGKMVLTSDEVDTLTSLEDDIKAWCRILGYSEDLNGIVKLEEIFEV